MTGMQFVWKLIATLLAVFHGVFVFVAGSTTGNKMINGENHIAIMAGFGMYLFIAIVEVVMGYILYRVWRSK